MKNPSCKNQCFSKTFLSTNRLIYDQNGDTPPRPEAQKNANETFAEITKAVQALEKERSGVEDTHKKLTHELVILLITKQDFFSPELLAALANRSEEHVRGGVAMNPNASKEILIKIAGDKDEYARAGVAKNQNAPKRSIDKAGKGS